MQPPPQPKQPPRLPPSPALSLGTNLAAGMVGCTLLGVWLDRRFGTGERYTLAGVALGVIYATYEVWKVVRDLQQGENDAKESGSSPNPDHE